MPKILSQYFCIPVFHMIPSFLSLLILVIVSEHLVPVACFCHNLSFTYNFPYHVVTWVFYVPSPCSYRRTDKPSWSTWNPTPFLACLATYVAIFIRPFSHHDDCAGLCSNSLQTNLGHSHFYQQNKSQQIQNAHTS